MIAAFWFCAMAVASISSGNAIVDANSSANTPTGRVPACALIPAPTKCEQLPGSFAVDARTKIFNEGSEETAAARWFQSGLKACTRLELALRRTRQNGTPGIRFELAPVATSSPEGYALDISSNAITLRSASAAGLFYGVQSLLQMAEGEGAAMEKPLRLPAMHLTDEPRFSWRGLMLDESRHFFGKQVVKELLDTMAYLKLNRFHWHLTDEPGWRLEIRKYPNLTKPGGRGNWSDSGAPASYYSQADISEIVSYARQRHIVIIPEIDMPGHATAATRAYPEISGGGDGKWSGFTFNPAKEETYVFLGNVLQEVAALFPGPYVHLGGDEVHYGNQSWRTVPGIVEFTQKHGMTNTVQVEQYFIRRMAGIVNKLGKTALGWDEIAGAGVEPSQTIVMWWHHEKPEVLTGLLAKGYPVVLCPRLPCYFDFVQDNEHQFGRRWKGKFNPLEDVYSFPDSECKSLIPSKAEAQVLGVEACLWTEQIQDRERLSFMTYPRLAALAEAAWTPVSAKAPADFLGRLPLFLRELDRRHIPYFNPFDPAQTPEPPGPAKNAGGIANG